MTITFQTGKLPLYDFADVENLKIKLHAPSTGSFSVASLYIEITLWLLMFMHSLWLQSCCKSSRENLSDAGNSVHYITQ